MDDCLYKITIRNNAEHRFDNWYCIASSIDEALEIARENWSDFDNQFLITGIKVFSSLVIVRGQAGQ